MAFSASGWLKDNAAVYFGNATNVRDFRAQLRGNRPVILWFCYLSVLILIVGLAYGENLSRESSSVAEMQRRLSDFYLIIMSLAGRAHCTGDSIAYRLRPL